MTNETLDIILQLLQRVDLKGSEVPAFTQVVQEIQREKLINSDLKEIVDEPEA